MISLAKIAEQNVANRVVARKRSKDAKNAEVTEDSRIDDDDLLRNSSYMKFV